jgi:hypothetical protein
VTEIVILGDSHVNALQRAERGWNRGHASGPKFDINRFARIKNGQPLAGITQTEAFERIRRLGPDDVVVSLIGGNEYNVMGLVQHPIPFDYFEPEMAVVAKPDAWLIPTTTLEAEMMQRLDTTIARVRAFREATSARVAHIVPPPPKGDDEFVQSRADSVFNAGNVDGLGVSPAALRLKLWLTQRRLTRRACEAIDVAALSPPTAILTDEGFLAPDFYGQDATHANADYGLYMLDMLAAWAVSPKVLT